MTELKRKPVAVIGFGGHGRVVLDALIAAGRTVVAVSDHQPQRHNTDRGIPILSDNELTSRFSANEIELVLGVGTLWPTPIDGVRPKIVTRFEKLGYGFVGFVHPTAYISPASQISPAAQVHAGVIVQPGAIVGNHAILNTRATVDHDCSIGEYVHIGPGAVLSGSVQVGFGSHLGTGCVVIQGIEIGNECFVSAGAVVAKSIENHQYVRGVPARQFTRKPQCDE
jgi:sugar O-acyltransferase (sialic acid O-acetyltransferase NeuD family)